MDARRTRRIATAVVVAMVTGGGVGTVPAGPVAGEYTHAAGGAGVAIGDGLTVTGATDLGGTWIDIGVTDSTSADEVYLATVGTAATEAGVVSVVGDQILVGDGTDADVFARIDGELDGREGRTLRIHFGADIPNAGFEDGDLSGWTAVNTQVNLGSTSLAGCTSIDTVLYPLAYADGALPLRTPGDPLGTTYEAGFSPVSDDFAAQVNGVVSTTVVSTQQTEGSSSLRLLLDDLVATSGFDVVHGPAVASGAFHAESGDALRFDWRAFAGDDAHSVFGYLLNVDTCEQTEVLDHTAETFGTTTPWAEVEGEIPADGTFRFVFVGGAFDFTGGRATGAALYVDDVRVFGDRATPTNVEALLDLLHYRNTGVDEPTERTVTVSTSAPGGAIDGDDIVVAVDPESVAPTFDDSTLADASLGVPYTDAVQASGWPVATYAVVDGQLPAGLTLDPSTGVLSGTPTAGGAAEFTVRASNVVGHADVEFVLDVIAAPTGLIDGVLTVPTAGSAYVDGVRSDGHPSPTYAVVHGALPTGLSIDLQTGVVSGIATVAGQSYSFTIRAANAHGHVDRSFTGTVGAVPQFDDVDVEGLVAGRPFADDVHAGGVPAPTYAVVSGALPAGIVLDAATGGLSGTPTRRGQTYRFTVAATNAAGSVTTEIAGTVDAVPVFETSTIDQPRVGHPVDLVLDVDATPAASFTVTAGALPAGLHLDSAGRLTGTPNARSDFDVTITATNGAGSDTLRLQGVVGPAHRGYRALIPARLWDSRLDETAPVAGSVTAVHVVGRGGVPADASAVVLNVAVTEPLDAGFVTVFPCGGSTPWTANVNFTARQTVSNAVTVTVGDDGQVCVSTSATTHVVIDVNGAYSDDHGAGLLVPMPPSRHLDTRSSDRVAAGEVLVVPVAGRGDVPADATAVIADVAVVGPATDGYATVFPCGGAVPFAANVNFTAGSTTSNSVVAGVGAGGAICVSSTADTDVVVDVSAAFSPTEGTGTILPVTPERLFDSRADRAPLGVGEVRQIAIGGRTGIPAGAVAVALNVAVTEPATDGYVTVYPCGGRPPVVASLTFVAGETRSNAVTVALGAGDRICVVASTTTHLVVDVNAVHAT